MTQVSAQFQSEDDAGSHITHMTSSEKTPVLVTTVDISPGVSVTLQVFAGDDPASVAEAFCAEHGLADSVVGPLREHIEENMREEAGFDEAIRAIEAEAEDVVQLVGKALERNQRVDGASSDNTGNANGSVSSEQLMNRANEAVAEVAAALESLGLGERYLTNLGSLTGIGKVRPAAANSSLASEFYGRAELPTTLQRSTEEEEEDAAERLYADHFRKERMLEEQRRIQELEEQLKMQQAHCTEASRAMAAHRTADGYSSYGERLYKEGVEDAQRKEALRLQALAEQAEKEMADVTFHPQISKLAQSMKGRKTTDGHANANANANGGDADAWSRLYHANAAAESKRLARHEAIRKEQDELEMRECSFHPQLSKKSERMMERRRLATTGSGALQAYDRLHYQGAHQKSNWEVKRELMSLPEEATFRPEINEASVRRAERFNKNGPSDVADRLLIRGQVYHERLEQARAELNMAVDPVTGQKLFHPVVSKRVPKNRKASGAEAEARVEAGPTEEETTEEKETASNEGVSEKTLKAKAATSNVGEHLYQEALESARRIQESRDKTYQQVDMEASKTHVNASSQRMMERLKRERIHAVFAYLARTPVDCLPPESIDIVAVVSNERFMDTIDPEVRADVELAAKIAMRRKANGQGGEGGARGLVLESAGAADDGAGDEPSVHVTEDEFVECMYEVISRTRGYTRTYLLPMPGTRVKWQEPTFKPELSQNSMRLATRSRPAGMPNHEILYKTAGDTAAKIEQMKRELEKQELELCTFKPVLESGADTRPAKGRALRDAEVQPDVGVGMVQRRGAAYKHPHAGIPGVKSSLFHVDVQGASSYADNADDESAGELDSPDALVDARVVESQAQFSESATISASVGSPPSKSKRSIYDIENGIDAIENEIKEAIAQLSVARDSARPKLQAIAAEDAMPDFVDRKMAVSLTAEEPARRLPLTTHFDVHAEF